jgi:hypothetical protein
MQIIEAHKAMSAKRFNNRHVIKLKINKKSTEEENLIKTKHSPTFRNRHRKSGSQEAEKHQDLVHLSSSAACEQVNCTMRRVSIYRWWTGGCTAFQLRCISVTLPTGLLDLVLE